jgi:hypothetical protein
MRTFVLLGINHVLIQLIYATTKRNEAFNKGRVSICFGGYLDWMKRDAGFIYYHGK